MDRYKELTDREHKSLLLELVKLDSNFNSTVSKIGEANSDLTILDLEHNLDLIAIRQKEIYDRVNNSIIFDRTVRLINKSVYGKFRGLDIETNSVSGDINFIGLYGGITRKSLDKIVVVRNICNGEIFTKRVNYYLDIGYKVSSSSCNSFTYKTMDFGSERLVTKISYVAILRREFKCLQK